MKTILFIKLLEITEYFIKNHKWVLSSDPFKNRQAKPKYHFEYLPVFAENI